MGSIVHINRNPKTWVAIDEGRTLTASYHYEPILKVRYGTFDDDPDGLVDMEMYMRKSIYDRLIMGEYKVAVSNVRDMQIIDSNNQIVKPINEFCY